MIEARELARLARMNNLPYVALGFDEAYSHAKKQGIDSVVLAGFRKEVEESEQIEQGTDLAGKALGLKAYNIASNLVKPDKKSGLLSKKGYVGDFQGTEMTSIRIGVQVNSVQDVVDRLFVIVQDPGRSEKLWKKVKPSLVEARPGFFIRINPLDPDNFGTIAIPGFVRNQSGIILANPSESDFATKSDPLYQEFAATILDSLPI